MRLLLRFISAVMLGVAAIFVPKREPEQHWSEVPTIEVKEEAPAEAPSGP